MCFFWKKKKQKPTSEKVASEKPEKPESEHDEKNPKYHVSQNKEEKSEHFKWWRVRKEGSDKTIKYFKTQKEAIAFAEALAKAGNTSVVVHKVDGAIRKQKY